jgi:hypothetical protein
MRKKNPHEPNQSSCDSVAGGVRRSNVADMYSVEPLASYLRGLILKAYHVVLPSYFAASLLLSLPFYEFFSHFLGHITVSRSSGGKDFEP